MGRGPGRGGHQVEPDARLADDGKRLELSELALDVVFTLLLAEKLEHGEGVREISAKSNLPGAKSNPTGAKSNPALRCTWAPSKQYRPARLYYRRAWLY